jgi:hypothetical protein
LAELIEAYSQLTDEGRAFVRQAAKVALGQYKKPAAAGGNAPAPSVSAVDGAIERTERSPSPAPEPAGDGAGFDAEEAAFLEMARQQFRAEKENGQKASSVKESGAG